MESGGSAIKNKKEPRLNDQITVPNVRLILEDGGQAGVIAIEEALARAERDELDLVEVSPDADPPVCRLIDYGKFKYQQQKRVHDQKKKAHGTEMKQIRIKTFRIDPHDLGIKLKKAREFLEEGHRLTFTLMFRSREHAHADLGVELLREKIAGALSDIAKMDAPPRKDGRRMTMALSPLPNLKSILTQRKKAEEEAARKAAEAEIAGDAGNDPDENGADAPEDNSPAPESGGGDDAKGE